MKTQPKKVHRNFKIDTEIDNGLRIVSRETGIPQTRILEDSLREFLFRGGAGKALVNIGRKFSQRNPDGSYDLKSHATELACAA